MERRLKIINGAAIGRVKKMARLPPDMTRDCLRELSTRGPNTTASTTGAREKSNFRMR
jgi:hypothetical protein